MSQMNAFDFYVLEAHSDKKTPLNNICKELGLEKKDINKLINGHKQYGRNFYPVYRYELNLAFCDAVEKETKLPELEEKYRKVCEGCGAKYHIRYIARD